MPVKNRLEELQMKSKHVKKSGVEADGKDGRQEEVPLRGGAASSGFADFFENMRDIIESIDRVRANVTDVRKLHKQLLYDLKNPSDESRLQDLVAENKRLGVKIRNGLKAEQDRLDDADLEANRERLEKGEGGAKTSDDAKRKHERRMRRTQISAQSRRFFDIWTEYNNEQVEYRDKSRELLKRRVKVKLGDSFDDEKIDEMLDKGDTKIFGESILEQTRLAKQQLTELQDRHEEFLKLERSITEVHSLFVELSALVTQQGEVIDSIAHNVDAAAVNVESGKDQLQQAEKHQKSARRKKMICAAIIGVAALILVLVILAEFDVFSSSGGNGNAGHYVPPPTTISTTTTLPTTQRSATPTRKLEEPIPPSSVVTEESIPSS